MKTPSLTPSDLVDQAEGLRQEGRPTEALKALERCLAQIPGHPRAVLLLGRLLYQEGKLLQARESLRPLESVLSRDEALKTIGASLEQLWRERISQTDPAFATETMAGLLVEQGYLLEAVDIYRRLFLAAGGQKRIWDKILLLKERLGQEGSRDSQSDKITQELEVLDRWIIAQRREE